LGFFGLAQDLLLVTKVCETLDRVREEDAAPTTRVGRENLKALLATREAFRAFRTLLDSVNRGQVGLGGERGGGGKMRSEGGCLREKQGGDVGYQGCHDDDDKDEEQKGEDDTAGAAPHDNTENQNPWSQIGTNNPDNGRVQVDPSSELFLKACHHLDPDAVSGTKKGLLGVVRTVMSTSERAKRLAKTLSSAVARFHAACVLKRQQPITVRR
jgi:hypothetical protein